MPSTQELPAPDSQSQRPPTPALSAPISNAFLPLLRIGLGACLLWQVWWYFSSDLIRNYYIDPPFHFTWYLFDWIQPWPGNGMYIHFYALAVAAACMMVGFYYRVAAAVFFVGYAHVFFIDRCWYLNHYYLIVLLSFIAMFLPAERRLSLDTWRRPELLTNTAPAWTLWLLRAQVGIPYFFGGLAKLNRDWLRGEPIRTWLAQTTDFPIIGQWFTQEWCVYGFVYAGILIDLLAVPLLLFRRTRPWAMAILMLFHLMNARLFHIGVFPWMMIVLTLVVFSDPRFWERFVPKVAREDTSSNRTSALGKWVIVVFLTVQLLAPLRHLWYPGHVAFTREGHCFAWRMKLNIRSVRVQFYTDVEGEDRKRIPLNRYIAGIQERKLRDPDMILHLAHHLSRILATEDSENPSTPVPVYAEATVALNGREPSPYVDPSVNLTTRRRSLGHADWIFTYPEDWP